MDSIREEAEECWIEDGERFVNLVREVINNDCSICNHNYFFAAVAKTKRFVFVDMLLLAEDSRVENYLHGTREEIVTIITCFEHIFTVREMLLMKVKYFPLSLETAGAFLDKGIPLEEVLANCSERA